MNLRRLARRARSLRLKFSTPPPTVLACSQSGDVGRWPRLRSSCWDRLLDRSSPHNRDQERLYVFGGPEYWRWHGRFSFCGIRGKCYPAQHLDWLACFLRGSDRRYPLPNRRSGNRYSSGNVRSITGCAGTAVVLSGLEKGEALASPFFTRAPSRDLGQSYRVLQRDELARMLTARTEPA